MRLIKDNAKWHYFVKKPIFELIPNLFLAPLFWSHFFCNLFIRYSEPVQLNFIRALTKESLFSGAEGLFPNCYSGFHSKFVFCEPKLRFQHAKAIEIRSSFFNLLLQVKFQSLFLELKLQFQKWIFYSGNKASILETELRLWVVSFDFELF